MLYEAGRKKNEHMRVSRNCLVLTENQKHENKCKGVLCPLIHFLVQTLLSSMNRSTVTKGSLVTAAIF